MRDAPADAAGPSTQDDVVPGDRERLPRVVFTSVVRSADKGESHGGVYLIDLRNGIAEQILDWADASIDWEGRGGDRGLRGIAFHRGRVLLAASDEIFVYDRTFHILGSIRNRYLKHCHEIFVDADMLFATSTGFDSVLAYDLSAEAFVRGYCVRFGGLLRSRHVRAPLRVRPMPRLTIFDPDGADGPSPRDSAHLNNVFPQDGALYVGGMGLGNLWRISGDRISRYARIPYWNHNARPFRDGVILNWSAKDRVAFLGRNGQVRQSASVAHYDQAELENTSLPRDFARQGFARGLTLIGEDLVVGGSSPSTVTLYRLDPLRALTSVNVSKDVRNCVHGLEVWPFS